MLCVTVEISDKHEFLRNNFKDFKKILRIWKLCSGYLKGSPNVALCVRKKIMVIGRTDREISKET